MCTHSTALPSSQSYSRARSTVRSLQLLALIDVFHLEQLFIWDMQSAVKMTALAGQHKDGVRVILESVSAQEVFLISAGDTEDMTITSWTMSRESPPY